MPANVLLRWGNFHSQILTANLQTFAAFKQYILYVYDMLYTHKGIRTIFQSFTMGFFVLIFLFHFRWIITATQQKQPLLHINAFARIFRFCIDNI